MEIKTKETIITQKIYIAKDGQEFQYESACKRYEVLLDLQNKKWFKSKIEKDKNGNFSILDFDDSYYLEFYWLDNEEDFSELLLYLNVYEKRYAYKGSGWYVIVTDRNDSNWIDVIRIEYLSDYLQEYKDNLDKWTNGILELVQSKEVKET